MHDDEVGVGHEASRVIYCSGYVVLFSASTRWAFVGNVLFAGLIRAKDFPPGTLAQVFSSMRDRLWPFGDDATFVSGFGPLLSFGQKRMTNPYARDSLAQTGGDTRPAQ